MPDPLNRLTVVGDRVLIAPQEGEERTKVGLYLPPTAVDHQAVQGGRILATGPGTPVSAETRSISRIRSSASFSSNLRSLRLRRSLSPF